MSDLSAILKLAVLVIAGGTILAIISIKVPNIPAKGFIELGIIATIAAILSYIVIKM